MSDGSRLANSAGEAENGGDERRAARPLIQADHLSRLFRVERGLLKTPRLVQALDGVSLQVLNGEIVGVVGQSASGKTTLANLLVRKLEPTFGRLLVDGDDYTHAPASSLQPLHRRVQLVPQDADVALDDESTVDDVFEDPLAVVGVPRPEREARIRALLDEVGLGELPLHRRCRHLGIGQRQLLLIARAFALEPEFLVCDDALACLDGFAKARVIAALLRRRDERGTACVLCSNDLTLVRRIAQRVLVLYAGRVIERGSSAQVLGAPLHPYTRFLSAAAPDPDLARRRLTVVVEGTLPSPAEPPSGCSFHPRCPRAESGHCDVESPQLTTPLGGSHAASCFHPLT